MWKQIQVHPSCQDFLHTLKNYVLLKNVDSEIAILRSPLLLSMKGRVISMNWVPEVLAVERGTHERKVKEMVAIHQYSRKRRGKP